MMTCSNCSKLIKFSFHKGHSHDRYLSWWQESLWPSLVWHLFKLTSMGLNRKLIKWMSNILFQRKLIIPLLNNYVTQLPLSMTLPKPLSLPYSPYSLCKWYNSTLWCKVNLSQFTDDITIWAQASGICRINLSLQKYLNQILTWFDS